MLAVWGTTLLRGLVPEDGISWQGHLFGAIGGVVAPPGCSSSARGNARPAASRADVRKGRARAAAFPLGAAVTLAELEERPASGARAAARAASRSPGSRRWTAGSSRGATSRMEVMRDAETFTVDDPRFSTGAGRRAEHAHARRRGAQAPPRPVRRPVPARRRCASASPRSSTAETDRLIDAIEPGGAAELRRALAGPLAAAVVTLRARAPRARGPPRCSAGTTRSSPRSTEITAGGAPHRGGPARLRARCATRSSRRSTRDPPTSLLAAAAGDAGGLERERVISNAAVLLFGGIETTEGMIANAVAHLLAHPAQLAAVRADPALLRERDRGVAAARAGGGGDRPLRDRRRRARRRADRARASS